MSGLDDLLSGPPKHLERFSPPWVSSRRTICGRPLADVAAWLSFGDAKTLIEKLGQTRAALLLCQTCLSNRHAVSGPTTWESRPAEVTADWVQRGRWQRSPEAEEIRALLLSLGRLVDAHRDEFDAMVAAYQNDEVTARRKAKGKS